MKRFVPLIFLLFAEPAFAEIPLKILRGECESTAKINYELVLQTSPGASASINGEPVHVYRTGTFGTAVRLKSGENVFDVDIEDGADTLHRCYRVNFTGRESSGQGGGGGKPTPNPAVSDVNLVVVSKPDAWLQYGTGSDRLGPCKMTRLCEGIALNVVGQTTKLYKVQLSEHRYAFIPKDKVAMGGLTPKPFNAGNITISNSGRQDEICVNLNAKVPWHCVYDPATGVLNVDLFGVYNNCNWVTDKGGLKAISCVDVQQVDSDVMRLVIKLRSRRLWGYSAHYDGCLFKFRVRQACNPGISGKVICLDAGHGGSNRGAISLTGVEEKQINLAIVRKLKSLLEKKGAKVILTRSTDEEVSMEERRQTAVNAKADMLVSVHCNAGGSAVRSMGTSTYFKHIQNRELANCIYSKLVDIPDLARFGVTGNFNFSLGQVTECPSVLVETAFVSSMPDEELLLFPEGQELLAQKIAMGIEEYFNAK